MAATDPMRFSMHPYTEVDKRFLSKNVSAPALVLNLRRIWLALDGFFNLESRTTNAARDSAHSEEMKFKNSSRVPQIFDMRRVFADVKTQQQSSSGNEDPQHLSQRLRKIVGRQVDDGIKSCNPSQRVVRYGKGTHVPLLEFDARIQLPGALNHSR